MQEDSEREKGDKKMGRGREIKASPAGFAPLHCFGVFDRFNRLFLLVVAPVQRVELRDGAGLMTPSTDHAALGLLASESGIRDAERAQVRESRGEDRGKKNSKSVLRLQMAHLEPGNS